MADDPVTIPPVMDSSVNQSNNITFTTHEHVAAYGSLYGLALLCIITGSIRSLNFVRKQVVKKKLIESSITMNEAIKFPITASCVLFGLYHFFKCDAECYNKAIEYATSNLPPALATKLSNIMILFNSSEISSNVMSKPLLPNSSKILYFIPEISKANLMYFLLLLLCWEGCVALATILKPIFSFILRLLPIGNREPRTNYSYLWSLKRSKQEMEDGVIEDAPKKDIEYLMKIEWDTHDVVSLFFCLSVGISHVYKRHWVTNNILGVAFSIYGIENLHLSSFKAGTMLLAGLFIYDIFWVFATDVMKTVAMSIDAPIILKFPHDIFQHGWLDADKYAMLGLGDIIIPGIFIALLRRFDSGDVSKKKPSARYYFMTTIIAYGLGLFVTMGVMHYFKAAQPALLYLVPACVLIPLFVAKIRGEASEMWNYSEDHLVENSSKKEKEKKN